MCCPLVFEFSVGIGGFVIGLGQISFFFSLFASVMHRQSCLPSGITVAAPDAFGRIPGVITKIE